MFNVITLSNIIGVLIMSINTCEFKVEGQPVGKARPRFSRKSGKVYTPEKTREYEAKVKKAAWVAMKQNKLEPAPGRCSVIITCYMEIPKSYSRQKRLYCQHGIIIPPRPDIDNLIKSALDGANEVIFLDDAQVWHVSAFKRYTENGQEPHMVIKAQWETKLE